MAIQTKLSMSKPDMTGNLYSPGIENAQTCILYLSHIMFV